MDKVRFPLLTVIVETIGDLNPQLLRELQGRLTRRNIALTAVCSLVAQGILLLWRYRTLTTRYGTCSSAELGKTGADCIQLGRQYLLIHWPVWWLGVFTWLSFFLLCFLVVGGTLLLISDLSKEERRGTLTFISLSPQSSQTLLGGKLLGVPILLFLATGLALPLHYWSGISAQIPLIKIVSFDVLVVASCLFFYSLAIFLGLVSHWFNGAQAWLSAAGVLGLLLLFRNNYMTSSAADWLYFFSPTVLLPYVTSQYSQSYVAQTVPFGAEKVFELQWFSLPLGQYGWFVLAIALINYVLWTVWLWQPIQRRFRNPQRSLLGKRQSYGATACIILCCLGFSTASNSFAETRVGLLLLAHMLWFVLLIVLLLPHHQVLQDWARFRRRHIRDWLWADESPVWGAIALNLCLANLMIVAWSLSAVEIQFWQVEIGLLFNSTLILMFALFNQIILLRPLTHRRVWSVVTLLGPTIIPLFLLAILGADPKSTGSSWFLLTPLAFSAVESVTTLRVFQVFVLQVGAIAGLHYHLNRQLRGMGESTTAKLFRGQGVVENKGNPARKVS